MLLQRQPVCLLARGVVLPQPQPSRAYSLRLAQPCSSTAIFRKATAPPANHRVVGYVLCSSSPRSAWPASGQPLLPCEEDIWTGAEHTDDALQPPTPKRVQYTHQPGQATTTPHTTAEQQQQQQQAPARKHTLQHLLNIHISINRRPAHTERLAAKLTSVLRDSTSSTADVADVLLVAEEAGCLNATHIAAALARLVRLAAAAAAAAAPGVGSDGLYAAGQGVDSDTVTAVVPLSVQQWDQMNAVRQAVPRALAARAASGRGSSSWHTAAAGHTAAGDASGSSASLQEQQEQQEHLVQQLAVRAEALWGSMPAPTITSVCWSLAHLQYEPPTSLLLLASDALVRMAASLQPGGHLTSRTHAAEAEAASAVAHDAPVGDIPQQQQQQLCAAPRQVVLMLWALARLTADTEDLLPEQQQQQQMEPHTCSQASSSSGISSGAFSSPVALLHHVLCCLVPHIQDLSGQGLLLLHWAAATWTRNSSSSSGSSSSSQQLPAHVSDALLHASRSALQAQALTPRGLAVLLWSLARLQVTPDAAWLAAWLAAMHEALPAAGPQDCAMSVWALATLGCPAPEPWLDALSRRAAAVASRLAPRELPALLWGCGRLRYRPPGPALAALLQQGGALAGHGALSPQGLALLLWSCGVLRVQLPGRWVDGVLAAVAGYLPLFRPVDASALWAGLVRLGHIPQQAWMEVWWAGSKPLLTTAAGQQVVLLLWCGVQLGQAPPPHWMRSWLAAAGAAMSRGEVTAQGYGLMWSALAQTAPVGLAPSAEWLRTYWASSSRPALLQELDALCAEKTLVGLAAVSRHYQGDALCLPPGPWVGGFLAASEAVLHDASLINIASMLHATRTLGLALPPSWLAAAMARLQLLLTQAGVLQRCSSSTSQHALASGSSSTGDSSAVHHGRSLVLSARLARRWYMGCLQQVLQGLHAQQLLVPRGQRQHWCRALAVAGAPGGASQGYWGPEYQGSSDSRSSSSSSSGGGGPGVLAAWPWLPAAVHCVWPDSRSAAEALQVLVLT